MVAGGAGHAAHPPAERLQLRRVAGEEAPVAVDGVIARQPHLAALVGVPVPLLEGHLDGDRTGHGASVRALPSPACRSTTTRRAATAASCATATAGRSRASSPPRTKF